VLSPTASPDHRERLRRDRARFARRAAADPRARAELVARFLPLAHHVARRYHRGSEPYDDLLQVAAIGLLNAVDRFDPARGVAFSTFAVPTMVGELRRHFRDRAWVVRPPRSVQELCGRTDAARSALTRELRRAPSVAEIAAYLGVADAQVRDALQARSAQRPDSLHGPLGADPDAATLDEVVGAEEPGFARAEQRVLIDGLLAHIPKRERVVLHLRFQDDMTQAEIGAVLGVSQMQVSRLIRQALDGMRAAAGAQTA
jgi:RNA polymerase sigma-B factor